MSKHTPGPWHISPHGTYIRKDGIHGWNIASIEEQPPYTEANAVLISKAPEMYDLLKRLSNWHTGKTPYSCVIDEIGDLTIELLKSIDKGEPNH